MARIRSIKPEYWKSRSIARLSWPSRLMFIALWSYVDDNGVGILDERLIAAELLPQEDDPHEARRITRECLDELARESRVTCYTVAGKSFLSVTGWSEHQKIDRPNKPRYPQADHPDAEPIPMASPLTCDDADSPGSPDGPSRNPRATPSSGTGEQGNRGTGDSADAATIAIRDVAPTAQTLLAEWIDACNPKPLKRVKGHVAKLLGDVIAEGVPVEDVRAGLVTWHQRRLHPATLPSVIHEIRQGPRTTEAKPSTTDQRVGVGAALIEKYAREEGIA